VRQDWRVAEASDREQLRQLTSGVKLPEGAAERLRMWSTDSLVDVVLDEAEPWRRRKHCVAALAGRIPSGRVDELLAYALDAGGMTEVRGPLLGVLSVPGAPYAGELLNWLRGQSGVAQPSSHMEPSGMGLPILRARGALGDLSAADALVELAADPWWFREPVGREGLDLLIDRNGSTAVIAELGASSAEELLTGGSTGARRLVAQRLVDDVTPALGDSSTMVARKAYEYLAKTDNHDAELRLLVEERGPGQAHLWALAVLHARGTDIRPVWAALGRPRIDLPGVPDDVRAAAVRTYVPGQRDTDPRWLLERACLEPAAGSDESQLLRRAVAALADAGLRPEEPISAGDEHRQGKGTYYRIVTAVGKVTVSTLGPFIRRRRAAPDSNGRACDVLVSVGFREIDAALAATRFEGLSVYYFGDRQPLTVGTLLFYWQD
jgi:hypothetical protein